MFEVITKPGEYTLVDQKKEPYWSEEEYREGLNELLEKWRELAMLFEEQGKVIGLAIPHLEPNTISEGRLFYFGMMPEYRGKGKATACHLAALHKLKRLGATHYVGSTDTANTGMIRIMIGNGAVERDRKGIYRINRN